MCSYINKLIIAWPDYFYTNNATVGHHTKKLIMYKKRVAI